MNSKDEILKIYTWSVIVAENSIVCLFCAHKCIISLIWSAKASSSIRSASSKIKIFKKYKFFKKEGWRIERSPKPKFILSPLYSTARCQNDRNCFMIFDTSKRYWQNWKKYLHISKWEIRSIMQMIYESSWCRDYNIWTLPQCRFLRFQIQTTFNV